jgi:hypothetical protein
VVLGPQLFEPLIDEDTFAALQKKLQACRDSTEHQAPRAHPLYLSGLVVCSHCKRRMSAESRKGVYVCSSWDRSRKHGLLERYRGRQGKGGVCFRNAVKHGVLADLFGRYLEETGRRLDALTAPPADPAAARLNQAEGDTWSKYGEALGRLTAYLAAHCPDDYNRLLEADREQWQALGESRAAPCTLAGRFPEVDEAIKKAATISAPADVIDSRERSFVDGCVRTYREHFDPRAVDADIARLEEEHTRLMRRYADLPTPRAREKAKLELAALESQIAQLEKQKADASGLVESYLEEIASLRRAVDEAYSAMRSASGEHAHRVVSAKARELLDRVECKFTSEEGVGHTGRPGRPVLYRLASVTFVPKVGASRRYPAEGYPINREAEQG